LSALMDFRIVIRGYKMPLENSVIEDSLLEAQYLIMTACDVVRDRDTWDFLCDSLVYLKQQYNEFRKENG